MNDTRSRRLRTVAVGVAIAAIAVVGLATAAEGTTPPCIGGAMDHGGGAHMDHSGGGMTGSPPTEAQKACARQLILDTRAAVKRLRQNSVTNLRLQGYISIGDELTGTTHYVKPSYHYDAYNLDPEHIEAFAARSGRVIAAMYILSNGSTMSQVPDIAGNWTMWHDHVLPFRSNNQYTNNYYRLGGMYTRRTAPMLHVWLVRNSCGPFAGTDTTNMTGSCHPEAEPGQF